MELIVGATGYVGGLIAEGLSAANRPARALARDSARLPDRSGIEAVDCDLLDGRGLEAAVDGISTAYYLVHSMDSGTDGAFAEIDRRAANHFATAAAHAGVERIVYLGGLMPQDSPEVSDHLSSRAEVESILLDAIPQSTALRASIIIGAGSSSFRLLVRLIERMRVLPMPSWRVNRTQPIDERDALEYLLGTAQTPAAAGRVLDIAGPDVVSYAELIARVADSMGVVRPSIGLPISQTPAASAVIASIVGLPLELVRPLMESLGHELLPRDDEAATIYGIKPRPFSRSIEHALREWERVEPLAAR